MGFAMLSILFWLLLMLVPQAARPAIPLQFEGDGKPHYQLTPEYLQLDAGSGWLRVPDIHAGLDLRLETRLVDAQSEASLELVGWRDGRIRIRLSERQLTVKATVRPEGVRLRRDYEAAAVPPSTGSWRAIHVFAKERALTITIDGVEIGRYGIDEFVGSAIVNTRKGALQIRGAEWRGTAGAPDEALVTEARRLRAAKLPNLEPAQLGKFKNPPYTRGAMMRRVSGIVIVEVVVASDGTVLGTTVTKSLDLELDREAVDTLRKWRFVPARLDGRPVASIAEAELTFMLR